MDSEVRDASRYGNGEPARVRPAPCCPSRLPVATLRAGSMRLPVGDAVGAGRWDPILQGSAVFAGTGVIMSSWGKHPRLQMLRIEELLAGKKIDYPPAQGINATFKQAPKAKGKNGRKGGQAPLPFV